MGFISYSQNFEDVMLWRALSAVKDGFYIDVGAWDPDRDSVTRAFYDQGWHGVNIEPVMTYFNRLTAQRPRDVNLKVAVGAMSGVLPFFEVVDTGLSTLDAEIAAKHRADGHTVIESTVEVTTLADICREYAPPNIHFLKIDVEQTEHAVLSGADFKTFRPWIVVVEATMPNTKIEQHAKWEDILLDTNYRFVWFDGLNRFYLAVEHEELHRHFRTPVNVFDDFNLAETIRLRSENAELSTTTDNLKQAIADRDRTIAFLERAIAELERAVKTLERAAANHTRTIESLTQRESGARDEIAAFRQAAQEREAQLQHVIEVHAARLDSVLNRLRLDDGPRALKLVLPLARFVRWVHFRLGAKEPAQPLPPAAAITLQFQPAAQAPPLPAPSAPRSSLLKKAVARPLFRVVRPLIRPLAVRACAFLTQEILQELRHPLPAVPLRPAMPARSRRGANSAVALVYRLVRPVMRPLAWRTRAFMTGELVAALRKHVPNQAAALTAPTEIRAAIGTVRQAIRTVHQFHAGSATGDAITNGMFVIQARLRKLGFESDIFVQHRDPELAERLRLVNELPRHSDYALIFHHSTGFDAFDQVVDLAAPKILFYHNITPPEFFSDNPYMQRYLKLGRQQLKDLRPRVAAALAVSEYNALELRALGYDPIYECTLLFDIENMLTRAAAMGPKSSNEPFTVLFVGRVTPSKAQADLVDAFAAFKAAYDGPCRLVLVGRYDGDGATGYAREIRRRASRHGIAPLVSLTGLVSDAELNDWYHAADLYVSLSNHEGFGVPLVEAMAHGVPVLAWPAGAVAYTLDGAGELLTDCAPATVAAAMFDLARDPGRRAKIIARQRQQLTRFELDRQMPALLSALALAGVTPPRTDHARDLLAANLHFTVTGHVRGTYSLATINRAIALALETHRPGRVRFLPVEGKPTTDLSGVPPEHRGAITDLVSRPKPPTGPSVVISQHYPPYVPSESADLCLALLPWEESLIPPALVATLSCGFHAVLATSRFVSKALIDSGITVPVIVSGQVPELDRFFPLGDERAFLKRPSGMPFTFLHVSSCFPRKGVDALLAAFAQEFRRADPVRLIVKGFPNPHNDVADQLARLQQADPDLPEIVLIDRDMDQDGLLDLYKSADAVVLPSRGEGFNMPAAEAMAAGIPLIVTGYGGHMDFCTAANARLVDYRFDQSQSHVGSPHSVWLEPDRDDLAAAMREVFDARAQTDGLVAARTAKARVAVRERLDPARWAERMLKLSLDMLLAPPARPMRLGWVTTWDVWCGVATYSDFLLKPIFAKDDKLAARTVLLTDDRTSESHLENGARVRPCWRLGDTNVEDLAAAIASEDVDMVVLQHQPGLIPWRGIVTLLNDRRLQHRHIVITLHSTKRLMEVPAEDQPGTLAALAKASRIIVHSIADLNFLKDLGLVDAVTMIPHGVAPATITPASRQLPATVQPVIGCYGFFLPGKGIPQLIEAVAPLRHNWPKLRLRLVNAEYPGSISMAEIAACRALASQLGLENAIEWWTDFLPNEESLSLLRACDLIVMPYEETKESASGAVRVALSSGVPVVTTPIQLFAELGDAVERVPGSDAATLAEAIRKLLMDAEARSRLQRSAVKWLAENSWESAGDRLHGVLTGLHATAPRREERFPWE